MFSLRSLAELNLKKNFERLHARLFAWLMRRMPNERQRLLAVTILAGGLCGLAAVTFHLCIGWA